MIDQTSNYAKIIDFLAYTNLYPNGEHVKKIKTKTQEYTLAHHPTEHIREIFVTSENGKLSKFLFSKNHVSKTANCIEMFIKSCEEVTDNGD
jgi:hypothetical protein